MWSSKLKLGVVFGGAMALLTTGCVTPKDPLPTLDDISVTLRILQKPRIKDMTIKATVEVHNNSEFPVCVEASNGKLHGIKLTRASDAANLFYGWAIEFDEAGAKAESLKYQKTLALVRLEPNSVVQMMAERDVSDQYAYFDNENRRSSNYKSGDKLRAQLESVMFPCAVKTRANAHRKELVKVFWSNLSVPFT